MPLTTVNRSAPLTSAAATRRFTKAPDFLSWMPSTVIVLRTAASVGSGWCSTNSTLPCTLIFRSYVPIRAIGDGACRTPPSTVHMVGNARNGIPCVFSVTYASSVPKESSAAAPTPSA